MTAELMCAPSWEELHERDKHTVRERYELEAVFMQHGDINKAACIETALRTAEAIDPGSIVLVEAANFADNNLVVEGKRGYLMDMAASVGLELLQEGPQSPKYCETEKQILEWLAKIQKEKKDMTLVWQAVLLTQLMQKGCAVFAADYDHRVQQPDSNEAVRLVEVLDSKGEIDAKLLLDESIGKLFRKATGAQSEYFDAHHLREWAALANGTTILARLLELAPLGMELMAKSKRDPARNKAYIVWGASHSDSLYARIDDSGYQADKKILVDEGELSRYKLPIDYEPDVRKAALSGALAFVIRTAINLSGSSSHIPELKYRLINDIRDLHLSEEYFVLAFIRSVQNLNSILDTQANKPNAVNRSARHKWQRKSAGDTQNLRTLLHDIGLEPDVYLAAPYTLPKQRRIKRSDLVTETDLAGIIISR